MMLDGQTSLVADQGGTVTKHSALPHLQQRQRAIAPARIRRWMPFS